MARVSLEGVNKSYGRGDAAVKDLDLEVRDREFLVLVGPSGCGKTTTLRMIAGLESLSSGRIVIGDKDISRVAPKDRDIAMVFQSYALYPHMTVYKNMAFGLELRYGGSWLTRVWRRLFQPAQAKELSVKRKQVPGRVRAAAQTLGIEHLLKRKPHQLSGGERQRVALGRSIVREPAAFLFDEPLSNLDARLRTEMRVELKRLHRQLGATMIYVTHDQVEALTLGDRIAVMRQGKLLQVGSPMEVYDQPHDTFVAEFLGSPGMNLWPGRLVRRADEFGFVPAFGESVEVRPEDGRGEVDHRRMIKLRRDRLPAGLWEALQSELQPDRSQPEPGQLNSGQPSPEPYREREQSIAVILGIRPEDLVIDGLAGPSEARAKQNVPWVAANDDANEEVAEGVQDAPARAGQTWEAEVVAVDRLGDSAMLYLALSPAVQSRSDDAGERVAAERQQRENQRAGDIAGEAVGTRDDQRFGVELVAKTSGRIPNLVGAQVRVGLELERIHFFDHKSGINLLKAGR